jgi:hypothetical protein
MVRSKGLHMLVLITEASYFNIMFFFSKDTASLPDGINFNIYR